MLRENTLGVAERVSERENERVTKATCSVINSRARERERAKWRGRLDTSIRVRAACARRVTHGRVHRFVFVRSSRVCVSTGLIDNSRQILRRTRRGNFSVVRAVCVRSKRSATLPEEPPVTPSRIAVTVPELYCTAIPSASTNWNRYERIARAGVVTRISADTFRVLGSTQTSPESVQLSNGHVAIRRRTENLCVQLDRCRVTGRRRSTAAGRRYNIRKIPRNAFTESRGKHAIAVSSSSAVHTSVGRRYHRFNRDPSQARVGRQNVSNPAVMHLGGICSAHRYNRTPNTIDFKSPHPYCYENDYFFKSNLI